MSADTIHPDAEVQAVALIDRAQASIAAGLPVREVLERVYVAAVEAMAAQAAGLYCGACAQGHVPEWDADAGDHMHRYEGRPEDTEQCDADGIYLGLRELLYPPETPA